MPLICLDPGHGGYGQPDGTENFGVNKAYRESVACLEISNKLKVALTRCGLSTLLTRTGDTVVSIGSRCKIANDAKATLYIAIHTNASGLAGGPARGTEVIVPLLPGPAAEFGKLLLAEVAKVSGHIHGKGIVTRESTAEPGKDYYGVIRGTNMSSVILEIAYHDNVEDCALLMDAAFRTKVAEAIARAVCTFYKVTYKEPVEEPHLPPVPPVIPPTQPPASTPTPTLDSATITSLRTALKALKELETKGVI